MMCIRYRSKVDFSRTSHTESLFLLSNLVRFEAKLAAQIGHNSGAGDQPMVAGTVLSFLTAFFNRSSQAYHHEFDPKSIFQGPLTQNPRFCFPIWSVLGPSWRPKPALTAAPATSRWSPELFFLCVWTDNLS